MRNNNSIYISEHNLKNFPFESLVALSINPDIEENLCQQYINTIVSHLDFSKRENISQFNNFIINLSDIDMTMKTKDNSFFYKRLETVVKKAPSVNLCLRSGESLLYKSIEDNNYFLFDLLLKNSNIDIHYGGQNKMTPLMKSIIKNVPNNELPPNIIHSNSDKNKPSYYINQLIQKGANPWAIEKNELDKLKTQLKSPAMEAIAENIEPETLLQIFCCPIKTKDKKRNIEKQYLIYKTDFEKFLNYRRQADLKNSNSSLMSRDRQLILEKLLETGLNPNEYNYMSQTQGTVKTVSLLFCIEKESVAKRYLDCLLYYGADPYLPVYQNKTLLDPDIEEETGCFFPGKHYFISKIEKKEIEKKSQKRIKSRSKTL